MPKVKKESEWHIGIRGSVPPYDFHVWFKGSKKPVLMYGFDEDHIRVMCKTKPVKIRKCKEKKEKIVAERLGPKGAPVGRLPEYEPAFKLLKAWVDSIGGPPEDIRLKLRELWIDYEKVPKKK